MVTEDEVMSYGYQTQVFADGKNDKGRFAIQVSACSTNPRLVVVWHSQTGRRCSSTLRRGPFTKPLRRHPSSIGAARRAPSYP